MATISDLYLHLKALCSQWFYTKSDTNILLEGDQTLGVSGKSDKNHTHGNISNDGKVGTNPDKILLTGTGGTVNATDIIPTEKVKLGSSSNSSKNVVTNTSGQLVLEDKYSHPSSHPSTMITNSQTLGNISNSTLSTQNDVNVAINAKIGQLSQLKFIEITANKGDANASKLGKLYIVSETEHDVTKVNAYYVYETGDSQEPYDWRKLDNDILDEFVVTWASIESNPFSNNTPSDFATSNHEHGQIKNDGKITASAVTVASDDNIVITDTSDSSKIKRVANLLTSQIKDGTAYQYIGSSQNATQAQINDKIDGEIESLYSDLGDKLDSSDLTLSNIPISNYENNILGLNGNNLQQALANLISYVGGSYSSTNALEDKLMNFVNASDSCIEMTIEIPTSTTLSIDKTIIYDEYDRLCFIDYGDGETDVTRGSIEHDYEGPGTYVIRIYTLGRGIYDNAFQITGLTSVKIPSSITSLGNDLFSHNAGLQSVRFESLEPPSATSTTFQSIGNNVSIICPLDSLNYYQNGTNYPYISPRSWKGWSDIATDFALSNHNHGYVNDDGTLTQTGSMPTISSSTDGYVVITNSSNQIVKQSAIDVVDNVVLALKTYGESQT